jgi:hypothetical protein
VYKNAFGNDCRVRGCKGTLVEDTMACTDYQGFWKSQQENLKWNPKDKHESQFYDQPPAKERKNKTLFWPCHFLLC